MLAEIAAVDLVAVGLEAVGERAVAGEIVFAAQGSVPVGGDVVVLIDAGLSVVENEEVGVAEVAEIRGGPLPKLLLEGGEPALGALPGVVGAVEVVSPVGAVAAGKEQVGGAEAGVDPGLRGERVRVIAAVGHEAVGGV